MFFERSSASNKNNGAVSKETAPFPGVKDPYWIWIVFVISAPLKDAFSK